MADSKDTSSSVKGSEEMFDVCCSSCNADGYTKEAKKFCVECGSHFCENCLRFHSKIPALQSHQIVDLSGDQGQAQTEGMQLPTERCNTHHGKLMDMFCGDHNEVCCGACIAVKHRSCVNVDYLRAVAKGVKTSKEHERVKASINEVLDNMKKARTQRGENLSSLEREKDKVLHDIDKYQDDIIMRIKQLADSSRQQVRTRYEEFKRVISADVDTLETLITSTTKNKQKLSVTSEAQLFVNVKASQKAVQDGESVLTEICDNWSNKHLKYEFDEHLTENISKMTSFGITADDTKDVKEYEATLQGTYDVRQSTDTSSWSAAVTGICPLEDGTILIIDYHNCKLKRLDKSYIIQDYLDLNGSPLGMCRAGKYEVAVCLCSSGKIQFVSIDSGLKLTSAIVVDKSCYGISYDASSEEISACCGKSLSVYNKTGTLLRTYQKASNGDQLFTELRQVAFNAVNGQIVVTDITKGLISLTTKGEIVWTFMDQDLLQAWSLCALPNGTIFVGGTVSDTVLQIDKTGRKIDVLIGVQEKLSKPYSIAFDRNTSRLIVGCLTGNIHVYTISKR